MPVDVVVSERLGSTMRFHVCAAGRNEIWEQGYSEVEAIDRLKLTHPDVMQNGVGSIVRRGLVTQDLRDIGQDSSPK